METNRNVRLLADVVHGYGRGILRGVAAYQKQNPNWNFEFIRAVEPGFTQPLIQQAIAGIIAQIKTPAQADKLKRSAIPAVNVSNVMEPLPAFPSIISDDVAVGRMAGEYFIERGFRKLIFAPINGHRFSNQRGAGFIDTVEAAGFDCPIISLKDRAAFLRIAPKPLAVFCENDFSARELIQECVRLNLHVPDHVSVLGVDDCEIHRTLSGVSISSIRLATEQIGFQAADLLTQLLIGTPPPARPILVAPLEVLTRRSSDTLALNDPEVAASVRFIRDRAGREINVQDLLAQTPLSRRSLEMRFRKALGRSPYQEIRRVQIERARLLLTDHQSAAHQSPDSFGFTEPQFLTPTLHETIGLSPRQYRRRNGAGPNGNGD